MQINVRNFNTETEIVKLKYGDTFYAPRSCPDERVESIMLSIWQLTAKALVQLLVVLFQLR